MDPAVINELKLIRLQIAIFLLWLLSVKGHLWTELKKKKKR